MATSSKRWLLIFVAHIALVFLFSLVCFLVEQNRVANPLNAPKPPVDALRWSLSAVAAICLLASAVWMYVKTNGKTGDGAAYGLVKAVLMSPDQFQISSIVALAFANASAIFGLELFFLGLTIKDFVPFAAGTLLVDLLYILPRGLKYWLIWEQEQKAKEQAANSSFSQSL